MREKNKRVYSKYTLEAGNLFGNTIRLFRKHKHMTLEELSQRAGINRHTLSKIENGEMTCEWGLVLEVACILGIPLFESQSTGLDFHIQNTHNQLVLLPKHIYKKEGRVDDDF